jgi:hypothetical protein
LDVADVLTLLKAYRDALMSVFPEPDAIPAGPAVALIGVRKGSSRFQIKVAPRLRKSVTAVGRAVVENDFSQLPAETRRSLKAMVASLKSAGRTLELPTYKRRVPILSSSTVIVVKESEAYSGSTTLFGRIRLTGGGGQGDHGRAELVLGDGTVVRLVAPKTLIKQLGTNLYDEVGVNGTAKWDSATNVPFQMDVSSIQNFSDGDPFERLARVAGDHWEGVDPEKYVSDLRSD